MKLLSYKVRKLAKQHEIEYHFLFMKGNSEQLQKIAIMLENQKIIPVIDTIFDFSELNNALKYSESGRAK